MSERLKEKLAGGAQRLNGKTDLLEAICAGCAVWLAGQLAKA